MKFSIWAASGKAYDLPMQKDENGDYIEVESLEALLALSRQVGNDIVISPKGFNSPGDKRDCLFIYDGYMD